MVPVCARLTVSVWATPSLAVPVIVAVAGASAGVVPSVVKDRGRGHSANWGRPAAFIAAASTVEVVATVAAASSSAAAPGAAVPTTSTYSSTAIAAKGTTVL